MNDIFMMALTKNKVHVYVQIEFKCTSVNMQIVHQNCMFWDMACFATLSPFSQK